MKLWTDRPGECEWLLVDAEAHTAGSGMILGEARIWTEDRRLVATGASQMAVLPLPNRT